MCLYVKTNKPEISSDALRCYKLMAMRKNYDGIWRTVYRGIPVDDDVISGAELMRPYDPKQDIFNFENRDTKEHIIIIGGGFIHSFACLEDAEEECVNYKRRNQKRKYIFAIFECTILPGTLYFSGVFESETRTRIKSYASTTLKVVRKISEY